jgi:hypothetical protein
MTFLEAALEVLKREGKPLHYKELTERAMGKKLLTFVGRTPEVTMQTQLTAAVKKAPGSPFVRVKPGVFGLLRYPEMPPEVEVVPVPKERKERVAKEDGVAVVAVADGDPRGEAGRGRRRRRRGGRGRTRGEGAATFAPNGHKTTDDEGADAKGEAEADEMEAEGTGSDSEGGEEHEPQSGNLSPEARAAALAETGVLEGDDAGEDEPADLEDQSDDRSPVERDDDRQAAGQSQGDADLGDDDGDDDLEDDDDEAAPGVEAGAAAGPAPEPGAEGEAEGEGTEEQRAGRRRRRRRRRRHGEEATGTGPGGSAQGSTGFGPPSASGAGTGEPSGDAGSSAGAGEGDDGGRGDAPVSESRSSGGSGGDEARARDAAADAVDAGQGARRIMTPVDAAIEILRGQAPGRGVHVRQIADAAARRRLVHGEPNEAWRVMRTALAAEPRERLRAGQRPRVRAAGSGLFALARRPPDGELERAEQVFGEARRALRERTVAALERRISELPGPAFEALARVLLQREGFGPATFVKRVEGTIYVEALRGRGSRPSRCLVGLRPGASSAGRRAIGELRAGIRARNQDEGVLLLAGRLAEDAIAEWKQAGPPVEIADGQAMAETCIRHGVGVINTMVSVDFVDADFFAELAEG